MALTVLGLGLALGAFVSAALAEQVQPVATEMGVCGHVRGHICGHISADANWTLAQSPYTVTCDAILDPGVLLTVEPGVEVRFEPDASLTVQGTLLAAGTHTQPITFTSSQPLPVPGSWAGLRFEAGSSNSALAWCTVEYATIGVQVYAVAGATVSPTLADCTIRYQSLHGVVVEGCAFGCDGATASPSLTRCRIEDNGQYGVYYYGHGSNTGCTLPKVGIVTGTLSHSVIRHNAVGIRLSAKTGYLSHGQVNPSLDGNRILDQAGHGISMSGDDPVQPSIRNNLIYSNTQSGIYWATGGPFSGPHMVNNTIAANGQHGIVCVGYYADATRIANNLVTGNSGYGLFCENPPYPTVSHNDAWTNTAGNYAGCSPGTGGIAADPLLVDMASGDFHLRSGSPCIDAGSSSSAPPTDIEGVSRPQGSGFDIGAHEFWAPEIQVKQGATEITAGDRYEFGRVEVGSSRPVTFTIGNLGHRALQVEAIDVLPADHFAVALSGTLPLTVVSGTSTTFGLHFAPVATGRHTATLAIASDDADENPYAFVVAGTGVRSLGALAVDGPTTGLIQTGYTFTATVGPADATQPITYTWRAIGQSSLVHTGGLSDAVSLAWSAPGRQVLTVTAANVQNAITRTHLLTLYMPARADFTATPTAGVVPLAVAFANRSGGDYVDSWWDFGDGVTSTQPNPSHTYRAVGAYTVALQVDGPGGQDIATRVGYISVEPCRAYLPLVLRNR